MSNLWEDDSWEDERKFHQVPINHDFMQRQESRNMTFEIWNMTWQIWKRTQDKTQKQERGKKIIKPVVAGSLLSFFSLCVNAFK